MKFNYKLMLKFQTAVTSKLHLNNQNEAPITDFCLMHKKQISWHQNESK